MELGEVERAMTVLDRITLPYLSASQHQHYNLIQAQIAYCAKSAGPGVIAVADGARR